MNIKTFYSFLQHYNKCRAVFGGIVFYFLIYIYLTSRRYNKQCARRDSAETGIQEPEPPPPMQRESSCTTTINTAAVNHHN